MSREAKDYTIDELLFAIKDSAGIVSTIAKTLDCSWSTAQIYINKYEETIKAYEEEKERVLDMAESQLLKKIREGNEQLIKYYLGKKGQHRNYGEKQEIDVKVEGAITINVNGVDGES
jgi:hypothetical protein